MNRYRVTVSIELGAFKIIRWIHQSTKVLSSHHFIDQIPQIWLPAGATIEVETPITERICVIIEESKRFERSLHILTECN